MILKGLACLAAGVAIGCFHFGGLWLTVNRVIDGKSRPMLFFASFVGRSLVTLAAIYFATGGQWVRVLFCVAGMLLSRRFFVAKIGRQREKSKEETAYELHGH